MIGLHIIADFKYIDFSKLTLDEDILKKIISDSLKTVWLNELWNYYHTFSNKDEITCIVALEESHISIHTWPEKQYVSLDIFVCNFWKDNTKKAKLLYKKLKDFFNPKEIEENFIERKSS